MAPERAEVEVKLGVPVERMWSAAKKIELLMPKVLPDVFVTCGLDGDGGPGSIRVYHCGPGTSRCALVGIGASSVHRWSSDSVLGHLGFRHRGSESVICVCCVPGVSGIYD